MIIPPTEITTDRLFLRPPQPEDAFAILTKYAQDPEVVKYLVWKPHKNIETTKAYIHNCLESWETGNSYPWVIINKTDKELIGMFELRISQPKADFGYVLAKSYWRKGFATEVTRSVIDWVKSQDTILMIYAVCDIENGASASVMEKAGLQKTGILPRHIIHPNISSEPRDCFFYCMEKGIDF